MHIPDFEVVPRLFPRSEAIAEVTERQGIIVRGNVVKRRFSVLGAAVCTAPLRPLAFSLAASAELCILGGVPLTARIPGCRRP